MLRENRSRHRRGTTAVWDVRGRLRRLGRDGRRRRGWRCRRLAALPAGGTDEAGMKAGGGGGGGCRERSRGGGGPGGGGDTAAGGAAAGGGAPGGGRRRRDAGLLRGAAAARGTEMAGGQEPGTAAQAPEEEAEAASQRRWRAGGGRPYQAAELAAHANRGSRSCQVEDVMNSSAFSCGDKQPSGSTSSQEILWAPPDLPGSHSNAASVTCSAVVDELPALTLVGSAQRSVEREVVCIHSRPVRICSG